MHTMIANEVNGIVEMNKVVDRWGYKVKRFYSKHTYEITSRLNAIAAKVALRFSFFCCINAQFKVLIDLGYNGQN